MPGPCQLPVPAETSLMQEFRFLPAVGMTYKAVVGNDLSVKENDLRMTYPLRNSS